MLASVLLTADETQAGRILECSAHAGLLEIQRISGTRSGPHEFLRAVRRQVPDLVLLDFLNPEEAAAIAANLLEEEPQIARVGFHSADPRLHSENPLPELLHGWVNIPDVTPESLSRDLWAALQYRRDAMSKPLFVVLPAKAGSGATTVSFHLADFIANEMQKQVLYLDADLLSGVSGLLLNNPRKTSIRELLNATPHIQTAFWRDALATNKKLQFLFNNLEEDGGPVSWTSYHKLLQFVSSMYDAFVADLPERVNDGTAELVCSAKRVLLVTTSEIAGLKLARRRVSELTQRGVPRDRIELVLNRWHKADLPPQEVSALVDLKVAAVIPNDYRTVQRAAFSGGFAAATTMLGRAYGQLATELMVPPEERAAVRAEASKVWAGYAMT